MTLDDIADELYGLPLDAFTATRDARAREARRGGNRDLATAVKALRKPTTSAWLANLLARDRADRLEELLGLGAALREAQAALSGDQLRTLSAQRHEVVYALAQEARRLAGERGQAVSEDAERELQETLEAALADPAAAEAVASARLTRALSYAGFGAVDVTGATATVGPSPRPRPAAARSEPTAGDGEAQAQEAQAQEAQEAREARRRQVEEERHRQRREAEREVSRAQAALEQAEQRLGSDEDAVRRAAEERDRLESLVAELAERLRQAEQEQGDAAQQVRQAQRQRDRSAGEVHSAGQALEAARARLDAVGR